MDGGGPAPFVGCCCCTALRRCGAWRPSDESCRSCRPDGAAAVPDSRDATTAASCCTSEGKKRDSQFGQEGARADESEAYSHSQDKLDEVKALRQSLRRNRKSRSPRTRPALVHRAETRRSPEINDGLDSSIGHSNNGPRRQRRPEAWTPWSVPRGRRSLSSRVLRDRTDFGFREMSILSASRLSKPSRVNL